METRRRQIVLQRFLSRARFVASENSSLIIGEMFVGARFVTSTSGSRERGTPVSVAFDAGGDEFKKMPPVATAALEPSKN